MNQEGQICPKVDDWYYKKDIISLLMDRATWLFSPEWILQLMYGGGGKGLIVWVFCLLCWTFCTFDVRFRSVKKNPVYCLCFYWPQMSSGFGGRGDLGRDDFSRWSQDRETTCLGKRGKVITALAVRYSGLVLERREDCWSTSRR